MEEAPPLTDADTWVNGEPVRLDATDRPVLLYIWRYADHQSRRGLQRVQDLHDAYGGQVQVVGVQSPRFSFEADQDTVAEVLDTAGTVFPVAVDPENSVRRRYGAVSRPYTAVIDQHRVIREEAETVDSRVETAVRQVLRRHGNDLPAPVLDDEAGQQPVVDRISRDVYAGTAHGDDLGNDGPVAPHTTVEFTDDGERTLNQLYLEGGWRQEDEYVAAEGGDHAAVRFAGRECSIVIGPSDAACTVQLYGGPVPDAMHTPDIAVEDGETRVNADHPGLYTVMQRDEPRINELRVVPRSDEFRLYAACFG